MNKIIEEDILKEIENFTHQKRICFIILSAHYQATEEDIIKCFEEVDINKIIPIKPGVFESIVIGKDEAIKFVKKSTGVNI